MTTDTTQSNEHQRRYHKPPPISFFVREFKMPDGRPIIIDKRALAFAVPEKEHPTEWTVIGFRTKANACPITTPIDEVRRWWLGEHGPKPERPEAEQPPPKPKPADGNGRAVPSVPTPKTDRPAKRLVPRIPPHNTAGIGKLSAEEQSRREAALAAARSAS